MSLAAELEQEYSALAASYEARWQRYTHITTQRSLAALQRLAPSTLTPSDSLLDVGCGTGFALARLADAYPAMQLFGVEPVAAMMARAKQHLPVRVQLRQARAEALPFTDNSMQIVISNSALHYFRQPQRALSEMQRVLKPGGKLILQDWCGDFIYMRFLGGYLKLRGRAHERSYRSHQLTSMLHAANFHELSTQRYSFCASGWRWGMMLVTALATE